MKGFLMNKDPISLGLIITDEQKSIASQYELGFKFGEKGMHSSRTIMLDELSILIRMAKQDASRNEYRALIVEENCLTKRTVATRKLTDQRLGELYALDAKVLLFRIMRQLWGSDEPGRPLLAILQALARDPLLRFTATPILRLHHGNEFSRQAFTDILNKCTGSRFNEATIDKIVRNTASSWTQSGHLEGRTFKSRRSVTPTPAVATFALLMGYILGARGDVLFETLWAKILDVSKEELIQIATDAKRFGYLDIKASGGIVDVSFHRLLTEEERRLIHGAN
jgi:hypothetical protein